MLLWRQIKVVYKCCDFSLSLMWICSGTWWWKLAISLSLRFHYLCKRLRFSILLFYLKSVDTQSNFSARSLVDRFLPLTISHRRKLALSPHEVVKHNQRINFDLWPSEHGLINTVCSIMYPPHFLLPYRIYESCSNMLASLNDLQCISEQCASFLHVFHVCAVCLEFLA